MIHLSAASPLDTTSSTRDESTTVGFVGLFLTLYLILSLFGGFKMTAQLVMQRLSWIFLLVAFETVTVKAIKFTLRGMIDRASL